LLPTPQAPTSPPLSSPIPTGWAALKMPTVPLLVSLVISNERNKNAEAENVDNNVDRRIDIPTENWDETAQEVSEKQEERPFPIRRSRMPIKCPHSPATGSCQLTGIILQNA
jgi:hypothetical protein